MHDLRYEQIAIEKLRLSVRLYNTLRRAGIETLAELVTVYEQGTLLDIPNLGTKSYEEVKKILEEVADGGFQLTGDSEEEEPFEQYVIPKEIENISVYDLNLTTRLLNGLVRSGFNTVGKILRITRDDMNSICGMGKKTAHELKTIMYLKLRR